MSKKYKNRFRVPFHKAGIVLQLVGIVTIGLKYSKFPFLVKIFIIPDIPHTLVNIGWALVVLGLGLQLIEKR